MREDDQASHDGLATLYLQAEIPIKRFAAVSETGAAAVYLASMHAARPCVLASTGG